VLRKFLAFKILFRKDKDFLLSLREILGFYPKNLNFYKIAFTHRSASFKISGKRINNERLEFLGDSILDAVISDFLYHKYPDAKEGFMTEMRSKIVNGEKLKELARLTRLNEFIFQEFFLLQIYWFCNIPDQGKLHQLALQKHLHVFL